MGVNDVSKEREVKFRAWHKEWKSLDKVISIDWDNEQVQIESDIGNCDWVGMDAVILMEYTGLKDKNGAEIYEGDIVADIKGKLCPVLWDVSQVRFAVNGGKSVNLSGKKDDTDFIMGLAPWITKEWTVIGNIYQNPELLEHSNA
jgi:uncharacterized phage protein (TIGR01671 family)